MGYVICLENNGRLQIETSSDELTCGTLTVSLGAGSVYPPELSYSRPINNHCNDCLDLPFICQYNDRMRKIEWNEISGRDPSSYQQKELLVEAIMEQDFSFLDDSSEGYNTHLLLLHLSTVYLLI